MSVDIREMRMAAGLTQQELAERTGIEQPSISRMERGLQRITVDAMRRIAEACGYEIEARPGRRNPRAA